MPQVNITVSQTLSAEKRDQLQLAVGDSIGLIPGKTIDNTITCIQDGCSLFKGGKPLDGAFVDIRLFKASPEESKKAFAEKLFVILKDVLGIDPAGVYVNYIELEHWASRGTYQ
jgi:phenylpyruvate tautomerase PptA (4-oxalocrotonate tautomerase family)